MALQCNNTELKQSSLYGSVYWTTNPCLIVLGWRWHCSVILRLNWTRAECMAVACLDCKWFQHCGEVDFAWTGRRWLLVKKPVLLWQIYGKDYGGESFKGRHPCLFSWVGGGGGTSLKGHSLLLYDLLTLLEGGVAQEHNMNCFFWDPLPATSILLLLHIKHAHLWVSITQYKYWMYWHFELLMMLYLTIHSQSILIQGSCWGHLRYALTSNTYLWQSISRIQSPLLVISNLCY